LGTLHTLRHITDFLAGGARQTPDTTIPRGADAPRSPAPAHAQQTATSSLERSVLQAVPLGSRISGKPIRLAPGAEIWGAGEDDDLARCLMRRLHQLGFRPRLLRCLALCEQTAPKMLGGLILIAPVGGATDGFLKDALFGLQRVAAALRQAGRRQRAVFVT